MLLNLSRPSQKPTGPKHTGEKGSAKKPKVNIKLFKINFIYIKFFFFDQEKISLILRYKNKPENPQMKGSEFKLKNKD